MPSSSDASDDLDLLRRSTTSDINRMIQIGNDINIRPVQQKLGGMNEAKKQQLVSAENLFLRVNQKEKAESASQGTKQLRLSWLRMSNVASAPSIGTHLEDSRPTNEQLLQYIQSNMIQLNIFSQRLDELKSMSKQHEKTVLKLWYDIQMIRIDEDLNPYKYKWI